MLLQNIHIYICILIYNTFCSATYYNDPPMIMYAVAQKLDPQKVKKKKKKNAVYLIIITDQEATLRLNTSR